MVDDKKVKADKIYDYYIENPEESLRTIGVKFNTSHSQVKRVLTRRGVYPRYKTILPDEPSDVTQASFFRNISINVKKFTKTEICLADFHIPYHQPDVVAAVLKYAKDLNPDYVVYLGDLLDFYQISRWVRNPEAVSIDGELYAGRQFLYESKDAFGDATHYFIEGNHEKRLQDFLFSKSPELSSLRALQLGSPDMLDLDRLDIEYVQTHDWMSTYEEPFRIGKLYHLHGHELIRNSAAIYIARNTLMKTLDNVIIGHHHTVQDHYEHGIGKEKLIGAWSVGCLCDLHPDYMPINRWINGFAEIHYSDDGRFRVINHSIYKVDGEIIIF